ncbi:MAG: SURF1 family protein [Rhizobiaceae bacterium]|nr:SURF1 family protein [Rhizobiaceae bacterium]
MTGSPPAGASASRRRFSVWLLLCAVLALAALLALGTWQVQRLQWKEALIADIEGRIHSAPMPLAQAEQIFAETGDVDYRPVKASGSFLHAGERHFFATHEGQSGFYVYTPLRLGDGRILFVNRGFVPYERKDPATRPEGQVEGQVEVVGLARNPLPGKPSFMVPENDPGKNLFYWKDMQAMAATAGLPQGTDVLPFFVDAFRSDVPGGIPVGGVTIVELPNNHLQYALTWYGLALALVGVLGIFYLRRGE